MDKSKFTFVSADIRIFTKDGKTEIGRKSDTKGEEIKWAATATKLGKGQYEAACALVYAACALVYKEKTLFGTGRQRNVSKP